MGSKLDKPMISTRDIADVMSTPEDPWSTKRARRWLERENLDARTTEPRRAKVYTTPALIAEKQPALWRELARRDLA